MIDTTGMNAQDARIARAEALAAIIGMLVNTTLATARQAAVLAAFASVTAKIKQYEEAQAK
jgi:hypothetical protein